MLSKIIQTLEYCSFDKEMLLIPTDISSISREQLTFLIDNELIQEFQNPKQGWCGRCDTVCDIEYKGDKKYFICWECVGRETINNTNLIKYFTNITALISFLQNILELNRVNEFIIHNRLLYMGSKGIEKYYFFHKISQSDSNDLIKDYIKPPDSFVLTLDNNHRIQSRIFNILEYLVFKESKCILALPKIKYTNSIASLGGQKKAERYSEVQGFIINKFNELKALNPKLTLEKIYNIIVDEIHNKFPKNLYYTAKKPKEKMGYWLLKDDNLKNYVERQIKKYKKQVNTSSSKVRDYKG